MRAEIADQRLTLRAETADERDALRAWATKTGHLFAMEATGEDVIAWHDAGLAADVRREPINITFDDTTMPLRLISNLAATPFVLDGRSFASIEGFWQGLKFDDDATREAVAALSGHRAKVAGNRVPARDVIRYDDREVRVGTFEHWALMERACAAKFAQHEPARAALLSTGQRALLHRVPTDSRTIPGVIMADIWMRLRDRSAANPLTR